MKFFLHSKTEGIVFQLISSSNLLCTIKVNTIASVIYIEKFPKIRVRFQDGRSGVDFPYTV